MPDMHHAIWIDAEPEEVFEHLATAEGLRRWWTAAVEQEGQGKGARLRFGFDGGMVHFDMVADVHDPAKRLVWDCTGEVEEWVGTHLIWDLTREPDGGTWLQFTHADWEEETRYFRRCNTTWGHLMYSLKDACEGESWDPVFDG